MNRLAISFLLVATLWWAAAVSAEEPAIPYPDALDAAAVAVDRLDSILEYGLLIGNGDVNGLVYTEGGQLVVMLTKNDVWDARLDSKLDPPLPTLDLVKRLARQDPPPGVGRNWLLPEGWGNFGPDSYHAHAYPCPRACARLVLTTGEARPGWQPIRTQGRHNAFQRQGDAAVMSIEGRAEASNGYSFGPLDVSTDRCPRFRLRLSGTENARWYVDLMGEAGIVRASGWQETPTQPEEVTLDLPPGGTVHRVILYTWTEDGARAENRLLEAAFEGPDGSLAVDLSLRRPPTTPARLDLRRAVAEVTGSDDGAPRAEVRALAGTNVFLVRSEAAAELEPLLSGDIPAASTGQTDGVDWIEQEIPGDADWDGLRFAVAVASRGEEKLVSIVTSRESAEPVEAAIALALASAETGAEKLIAEHEAAWAEFWSASGVDLDHPDLEAAWYRNLYFLRTVSKPGAIAPGLFASLTTDHPAWHGDYHTNYNIQQTFWSAYVTNHPELAEPYDRLIREYLPRARWLARRVFSMDGAYFPHVLFAYEPPDPEKCQSPGGRQYLHHVWGFTIGVSGFTVQPLWWHYKYRPDRAFLEETAYPAVRDVADFYAAFLDQCDGGETAVLAPSVSPEHWGWTKDFARNRDCAFDIAMIRYTLEAAIEGAETLGRDADRVARWRASLGRLPDYPTTGGDEPVVVDVADAPPITYNIAVPAVPVFPGDVVTQISPPAEQELFTRTVERLRWNGNNSAIILGVARARLGMEGTADWLREELTARLRPNGTLTLNRLEPHHGFNDFGHYTEQFAASMAVSELLLGSVGDVIRVFPAWPADRDAGFSNLRAQGGFLVSSEHRDGAVTRLEITSTTGGRLKLASPWPAVEVRRAGGQAVRCTPDDRGIVDLETAPGERLDFSTARD